MNGYFRLYYGLPSRKYLSSSRLNSALRKKPERARSKSEVGVADHLGKQRSVAEISVNVTSLNYLHLTISLLSDYSPEVDIGGVSVADSDPDRGEWTKGSEVP